MLGLIRVEPGGVWLFVVGSVEPARQQTIYAGTTIFFPFKEVTMPAKSKAQQMAAGAALAAKRGEQKVSELDGAARSMYDSMSEDELEKMASTERTGKPRHDSQS
ncbi:MULTISPECIES: DUF3008 family protein [Halomonas]|nr:DUF3008 family protein [Halomonas sp. SYSU XM8]|tara:strand:+ start:9613 stop:9927 length:315 start_codon:yes stop_codon:yes gene_type:complete